MGDLAVDWRRLVLPTGMAGRQACDRAPKGEPALAQKRPQIKKGGAGVHRASYAQQPWISRPCLKRQGITRQLPDVSGNDGASGRGVHAKYASNLEDYLAALSQRLRRVRVCCGDWTRVLGPSVTTNHGLTGIVFDPPYAAEEDRDETLYTVDDLQVAHAVRDWCLLHGHDPLLRLVLCGYDPFHDALLDHGWRKVHWRANGGYGNQGRGRGRCNKTRETLWLSPHCLDGARGQLDMFM